MAASKSKLKELVLFICKLSKDDPNFGSTKLNKLLFFSDFWRYWLHGKSITGEEYQRLPYGPAPRKLLPLIRDLKSKGELRIEQESCAKYTQNRPIAEREPKLGVFSADEIGFITATVRQMRGYNATGISEFSHLFDGWKLAQEGETIPYEVVLVGDRPPTDKEQKRGLKLTRKAEGCLGCGAKAAF